MKTIFIIAIIIIIIGCVFFAFLFPKGSKILGMPAEMFFKKDDSDEKDID
ncbi:hypothetical protein U8527_10200 [Kordia algicida OT-1]|uniref:Uncharacterized protein n=1 Tax=Kordia algicida OT-1 TaxID=391587 RepID=A9DVW6_9FLAO|nr:hypothetical protein [Kordia algicida]EDP96476.1 hypothetical protein KAOT1_03667 [Kordia algicida OT-1]